MQENRWNWEASCYAKEAKLRKTNMTRSFSYAEPRPKKMKGHDTTTWEWESDG
jgi:hypothetical protein